MMKRKFLFIFLLIFLIGGGIGFWNGVKYSIWMSHGEALGLWGLGVEEMEKGNYEIAIQYFYQGIGKYKWEPLLYIALGDVYYKMEKFDLAERNYKIALTLKPKCAISYIQRRLQLIEKLKNKK